MGLPQHIKALYENKYSGANLRQIVYPVTGLGAGTGLGVVTTGGAALTWGVWVDVVIAADITTDSIVTHIFLDTASVLEDYAVQIGNTTIYANAAAVNAVDAATILAAARAEVRVPVVTLVGPGIGIALPIPVFIGNGQGIIARSSTVSGADTINVACAVVQNFN